LLDSYSLLSLAFVLSLLEQRLLTQQLFYLLELAAHAGIVNRAAHLGDHPADD
jgi:hypothetical protein